MAIQTIDLGTIPLNGTNGDNARAAFTKVNANFAELDSGKQPLNAKLTALATATMAANQLLYSTGANTFGVTDFPADSRTFLAQTTPIAKRAALELVKTTSRTDATAGSILQVGDGGLLATAPSSRGTLAAWDERVPTQFFLSTASAAWPFPHAGVALNVSYNTSRNCQMAWSVSGSQVYGRNAATADTWGPVYEYWTSANLLKQDSVSDVTAGRMLINGAHGLGGTAISRDVAQSEAMRGSEIFRSSAATSAYGFAGCGLHMSQDGSQWASQLFVGLSAGAGRAWIRSRINSTSWGSPIELWTAANLTPNVLTSYTLTTLPTASANPRLQAWCSNLTGGAAPVYSNGTSWFRTADNTAVN